MVVIILPYLRPVVRRLECFVCPFGFGFLDTSDTSEQP